MRRSRQFSVAIAFASIFSALSYANTVFTATVTGVGTYGNGAIFIFLNTAINEPGCNVNSTRIDVPASNPNIKEILAVAMTAFASGKEISGAVNGCDPDYGAPTLDQSYNSYIYMTQ